MYLAGLFSILMLVYTYLFSSSFLFQFTKQKLSPFAVKKQNQKSNNSEKTMWEVLDFLLTSSSCSVLPVVFISSQS